MPSLTSRPHNAPSKLNPNKVKQARLSRGISAVELAEKLGKTRQTINQYEIGTIEPPISILKQLGLILGYHIEFFYKESGHVSNL